MSAEPAEDLIARLEMRITALQVEGQAHIASWRACDPPAHTEGPDPECEGCDDIFGEAWLLSECLAALVAVRTRPHRWQPIETAPKDGTVVRLRWQGTTVEATGRWCPANEWPKPLASDDWRDVVGDDVLLMPTHWRPDPPGGLASPDPAAPPAQRE